MKSYLFNYIFFFIMSLLLNMVSLSVVYADEKIPDDVRYLLIDMYGENEKEWPSPRYKTDLNNDGFSDWVVIKKNCLLKNNCPAEIFLCVPDKKGLCLEYCYIEVKSLINIKHILKKLKCETTC